MRQSRLRARRSIVAIMSIAIVGLVSLVAVGCGSNSPSSNSSASSSTGATTTVAGIAITADPSLAAMLPDSIKSSGILRVAMNIPYPPWEMYASVGSKEVTGLDWDLSQALAAKLGVKAQADQLPFDSMIPAVQAGKEDVVISAVYDSKVREQVLDFVDYAYDGTTILVPKGNPKQIKSLDDLAGKTVDVVTSSSQAKMADELQAKFKADGKPAMNLLQLPNSSDLTLALVSGKAEASLTDLSAGAYAAKTYNDGNAFEIVIDPADPNGYTPGLVGAGVLKGNTQLLDSLQKALQSLIDDGTYAKFLDLYGLAPAAVKSAEINHAAF